jgi:hypothetical protein
MGQPLNIFYCQAFGGHIYVRVTSYSTLKSIRFTLLRDGVVTAEQLVASSFTMFRDVGVGIYKSVAEMTFNDDSVATIVSGQVRVKTSSCASGMQTLQQGGQCLAETGGHSDVSAQTYQEHAVGAVLAESEDFGERIFRIVTEHQFVLLDQDIGYLHQQLLNFDIVEISACHGVCRDEIVFPDAGHFPQGRIISFDSQAQWNTLLVVNGRRLLMSEGSAARYVAYRGCWRQIL